MSEEESIEISARDLMPNWLDDLENPQKIAKKYAEYEGGDEKRGRGKGGQYRGDGRDGGRGKPSGGGGGRPPFGGGGGGGGGGRRPSGGGVGERDREGKGRGRGPRQGGRDRGHGRDRRDEERRPAPPAQVEGIDVVLLPEASAIESIAKYVRTTGRAYPMWDIARTMLGARERYRIGFRKSRDAGEKAPDLLRCSLDDSLWLTREEALQHVVRSGLLSNYYRTDVVEVEPPKGNFTAIAVHPKSGVVLGPPNHHEYRPNLMKLHQKRFSHVPFDRFSKEIVMKRDEETLEAWKESKTKVRHFVHVGLRDKTSEIPKEEAEAAMTGEGEAPVMEEGSDQKSEVSDQSEESSQRSEISDQSAGAGEGASGSEEPVVEDVPVGEGASSTEEAPVEVVEGETPPLQEEAPVEVVEGETPPLQEEAPVDETPAAEELVLKTEEEVAKHFSETYGDVVFFPVSKFFVPGDVKGSQLSRGLLALLRDEVEARQRAPMTLIQDLCRGLEKHGMKFFKEGKKMFVSAARPRGLEEGVVIADSPMRLLKFVEEHQGTTVMRMMAGLVPGFEPPAKGERVKEHKPTAEEMHFVSDMRWLTSEGYLVEYSHGKVRLGNEKRGGERSKKVGKKENEEVKVAEGEKGESGQRSAVSGQPAGAEVDALVEETPVVEDIDGGTPPLQENAVTDAVVEVAPVAEEAAMEEVVEEASVEKAEASETTKEVAEESGPAKEG